MPTIYELFGRPIAITEQEIRGRNPRCVHLQKANVMVGGNGIKQK